VSYSYNQLSQLTSEARTFTGVGSFTLSYAYNLAGAVTSLTDPFGAQVGYSYDAAGRASAVTGSGFAGVSDYLTNVQYRAWGALKSGSYGNSKSVAVTYDNALRPATYEVPGIIKKSYQYYADGSSKFVQDQLTTNSKFDRSYTYDHAGRITTALSGAEARGGGPTDDRPYKESLTYDAMDNLTARTLRHWNRDQNTGPDTFLNNRKVAFGWTYDADGRSLISSAGSRAYNAAGDLYTFDDGTQYKTDQSFDGDGQKAHFLQQYIDEYGQWVTDKSTYFVRSSVLGGTVISEVSGAGGKERTFIHSGGSLLAIQSVDGGVQRVDWRHVDPLGNSLRNTNAAGQLWSGSSEMDPFGADAGTFKPITWPPPSSTGRVVPYGGIPELLSPSGGCVLDGVPTPCEMTTAENSARCPDNDCRPRAHQKWGYDEEKAGTPGYTGEWVNFLTTSFMSFANGVSNFFAPSAFGTAQSQADAQYHSARAAAAGLTASQIVSGDLGRHRANRFLPSLSSLPQNNPQTSEQARKDRDKLLTEALNIAKKLLESHKACSDYLGTLFASAESQLNNARFFYGGHSDDTIAQASPGGPIQWSSITLYDHFYSNSVGGMTTHFDLTGAMARAFVLLHETAHNTGRIFHVPGVKAWSQEELDKNIYELCGFAAGGSW
jgi:YD repeat-containing protein